MSYDIWYMRNKVWDTRNDIGHIMYINRKYKIWDMRYEIGCMRYEIWDKRYYMWEYKI